MLEGYYIKKIGQNRGAPRVWLEGTQTERAGFGPGQKFDVVVQGHTIVLRANPDGSRIVSSKKAGEKQNPVIDINSRELLAIFDGMSAVRVAVKKGEIYLLPLASEIKKRERFNRLREKLESGEALTVGSLSHGGGVLSHAIHTGLQKAGIASTMGFANEIREELLEHAAVHNDAWTDDTKVFAAPMQELAFDDRGVAQLPKVEVLEMGLPCSGASKAGMAKRGAEHARVKEVPERLVSGLSDTVAHELLGQSVVYPPFRDVGQHVGNALNRAVGRAEVPLDDRAPATSPAIPDGVADLAREVVATFRLADVMRGQYSGVIVAIDRDVVIQDVGRDEGVIHRADALNKRPKLGQTVKIAYEKGKGKVEEKVRAPQFALNL